MDAQHKQHGRLVEAVNSTEVQDIGACSNDVLAPYVQAKDTFDELNTTESQRMVAMLNETIGVLSAGSPRSLQRLKHIEQDLERASDIKDVAALRQRLSDCLQYVRHQHIAKRRHLSGSFVAVPWTSVASKRRIVRF